MPRRRLVALLLANAVSVAGTRISAVAVPWLVLTTTGSAARTGLVAAAELLPLVVSKAVVGPFIDRIGPRRISIVADLASAAAVALVPLLYALGDLHFGLLLVVVALVGAGRGPGDTAKETLGPDLAEATGLPIERITGLVATVDRSASIVAPALAGLLIAAVGAAPALAVDAATFVLCAIGVAAFVPRRPPAAVVDEAPERYRDQLKEGLRYLADDRLMRAVVGMVGVTNMLDMGLNSVLLPTWVHTHGYGPGTLGLIGSVYGLASTGGSVLAAVFGQRLPRRATFVAGFLLCGAPRWVVLGVGAPLPVVLAVCLIGGTGAGVLNPILSAVYVQRVPRALLGRVNAMSDAVAWAGMPLGSAVAGLAVVAIGLAPVLLIGGGAYFLTTLTPARGSAWRELDRRPDPAPGAVADRTSATATASAESRGR